MRSMTCSPNYLPTYLATYLLTYVLTYLLAGTRLQLRLHFAWPVAMSSKGECRRDSYYLLLTTTHYLYLQWVSVGESDTYLLPLTIVYYYLPLLTTYYLLLTTTTTTYYLRQVSVGGRDTLT